MNAFDTLFNITNNDNLCLFDFKYCLVNDNKLPFKINETFARPNHNEDFSDLIDLTNVSLSILNKYKGIGISIQASNVCAIDIDHCVSNAFDVNSIDNRAKTIIDMFKDIAYIEFSFSGHGIRIFFQSDKIENYDKYYYTKNSTLNVEFYYPEGSNRYVTITGKTIYNNKIQKISQSTLLLFLNTFMKRQHILNDNFDDIKIDNRTIDDLMKIVKTQYLTNFTFQELWFSKAPGSGHDESERDYHLIAHIYDFITKDKDKIKQIFEQSPFFKSKDYKHMNKWTKNEYRYYNYLYSKISNKGV